MINEKVKSFFLFQNFNKVKIFFSTLAHNESLRRNSILSRFCIYLIVFGFK